MYIVLRMCSEQYVYCYIILTFYCACVAHNRRTAHAACTLGGIVCMVFRVLVVRTLCRVRVRAWDKDWVFHAFLFFFPYLKVTNTFVLPSWAEAWCKCDVMRFIHVCLHGFITQTNRLTDLLEEVALVAI